MHIDGRFRARVLAGEFLAGSWLNLGSPITLASPKSAPARAYDEAAQRLMGVDKPVSIPNGRNGFLTKLFGRRAA